ncbi:MAG: methylenetetrahydrofolate--tRNA-(uracil(54)-C(5))-methyltransferase (FADH(2)-oxidizing) TrmFO [Candidatus Cloacimonetes bacterium]|nr:methylenetetrahydrofolate--tRNA-(uracil(54)-C(5))-methyltransferase (FADH(2)-oxidizing) TrmFO [Candidatus Cloacimonadota bacterium]
MKITIIGAGLSGCEAALQLANAGWKVDLYEMRPHTKTPAHQTDLFAELVCSNSLKSNLLTTASGLLKAEMDILGCELLKIAREYSVPAGNAIAVDRFLFANKVTFIIKNHKNINFINKEYTNLPSISIHQNQISTDIQQNKENIHGDKDSDIIIACGPLISDKLTKSLIEIVGDEHLYFFDAIAPIIDGESIDLNKVFSQSRYNKGLVENIDDSNKKPSIDYINCPFDKDQYIKFVEALLTASKHEAKEFENEFFNNLDFKFYENCLPIEELARRGIDTLRFGVMKPVGLINPKTEKRPYAVIQLRAENGEKTAFNLVGCQTMLKYSEQKRIFSLIPGLENAEFLRLGSIHRNTYLNTPEICNPDFSLKIAPHIRIAGQIAGVEGYVESIFSGLLTAKIIMKQINYLPEETISGQLWRYLTSTKDNFTPMNANFGLLPEIVMERKNKSLKKDLLSRRSIDSMMKLCQNE